MTEADRYLVVAVDVEALPNRATGDHVERLIWGRTAAGQAGIAEMAGIAEEFGVAFTFFVDMAERELHGPAIDEAVRWLASRGQDVELHLHPEILPADFWPRLGLGSPYGLQDRYDFARLAALIRHFADILAGLTGMPAAAYRAGSFRWSATTIRALQSAGIPLSFNHSAAASRRGKRFIVSEPGPELYRWDNGVVEIPCTEFELFGRLFQFQFPSSDPRYAHRAVERYLSWRRRRVSVLDLHSWSFLAPEPGTGHFTYGGRSRLDTFRRRLERLCRGYKVVSSRELAGLIRDGRIAGLASRKLAEVQVAAAR